MSIVSISYICLQLLLCTQSCDNACFNLSINKEKLYDFFALKWSNQFQQPQNITLIKTIHACQPLLAKHNS